MSLLKKISIGVGIGTFIVAPFAIVAASKLGTSGVNTKEIAGEGSSSIHPLIRAFTNETNYSIQYNSNGSGAGKESQVSGEGIRSSFGMMSSTKEPKAGNELNNWKKRKIRTVTWGLDAIGIAMKMPSGIKIMNNDAPIINIQELSKLYDIDSNTTTTWEKLLENENPSASNRSDLAGTPFGIGRTGGKSASGTADGFWHILSKHMAPGTTPDWNHSNLGNENKSDEANAKALEKMKYVAEQHPHDGALTYLSLGYTLNNIGNGVSLATIKNNLDPNNLWVPTIQNAINGIYKWTRPFNIAYSVNNKEAVDFAAALLSPKFQNIIKEQGFVPLKNQQIRYQFPLTIPDKDILATLNTSEKKYFHVNKTMVYGLDI